MRIIEIYLLPAALPAAPTLATLSFTKQWRNEPKPGEKTNQMTKENIVIRIFIINFTLLEAMLD